MSLSRGDSPFKYLRVDEALKANFPLAVNVKKSSSMNSSALYAVFPGLKMSLPLNGMKNLCEKWSDRRLYLLVNEVAGAMCQLKGKIREFRFPVVAIAFEFKLGIE